jgi:hypothetical protein
MPITFMSCVMVVTRLISTTGAVYVHRTMNLRRSRHELDGSKLEAPWGVSTNPRGGSPISARPFTRRFFARGGEFSG